MRPIHATKTLWNAADPVRAPLTRGRPDVGVSGPVSPQIRNRPGTEPVTRHACLLVACRWCRGSGGWGHVRSSNTYNKHDVSTLTAQHGWRARKLHDGSRMRAASSGANPSASIRHPTNLASLTRLSSTSRPPFLPPSTQSKQDREQEKSDR